MAPLADNTHFDLTPVGNKVRADLVVDDRGTSYRLGDELGMFDSAEVACIACEKMGYRLAPWAASRKS